MDWKDEYGYYLYSDRKSFGTRPSFYHSNNAPLQGFSSLYAVPESTAAAILEEGTTKGFKGIVWSEWLKIDVDSYGETARSAKSRLIDMELGFIEYDSGGKGHHFYVKRDHIPSHLLPQKDKLWVKSHFPEADPSIYTHLHLFRLPGTKHEDTGKYKKILDSKEGNVLVLPERQEETHVTTLNDSNSINSIFSCFRVMSDSVPVKAGERHASLVRLTYSLRDDAKVDQTTALWWVKEVNKLYDEPKAEEDLEKIIRTIYLG